MAEATEASATPTSEWTAQKVYDTILFGLRKQAAPSIEMVNDRPACRYRSKDGKKCAAGMLIPDELYKPEFEIWAAEHTIFLPLWHQLGLTPFLSLIQACQSAHDDLPNNLIYWLKHWESKMKQVARFNDLVYTPPAQPNPI